MRRDLGFRWPIAAARFRHDIRVGSSGPHLSIWGQLGSLHRNVASVTLGPFVDKQLHEVVSLFHHEPTRICPSVRQLTRQPADSVVKAAFESFHIHELSADRREELPVLFAHQFMSSTCSCNDAWSDPMCDESRSQFASNDVKPTTAINAGNSSVDALRARFLADAAFKSASNRATKAHIASRCSSRDRRSSTSCATRRFKASTSRAPPTTKPQAGELRP